MRRHLLVSLVCACLSAAACSDGGGRGAAAPSKESDARTAGADGSSPASITPAPAGVTRTLRSKQIVQFTGSPFEEPAVAFAPGRVRVGKDIEFGRAAGEEDFLSAAVAFEPVDPALCVSQAELVMRGDDVVGKGEVRAYPSAALSLAQGHVPPNGDRPTTLLDNRPFGFERIRDDGTRVFDVTELVRLWAAGGTFPSRGKSVPPGSPVVLLLRPPALDEGTYEVQFDVAAHPPTLTVTSCPSG